MRELVLQSAVDRRMIPVVTNEEFLRAAFGPEEWERAHVTGFMGDPAGASRAWRGGSAGWKLRAFTPGMNTYFVISLFRPDARGGARRRGDLFRATYLIVVDDVGQKVQAAGVLQRLGPASYRLETSPGNEQWGYFLAEPVADAGRVEALLGGLVANGLAPDGKDPGMTGVTRYGRLPAGTNTKAKYGPGGFPHRLLEWEPQRRFTLEHLAAPYGVDLDAPRGHAHLAAPRPGRDEDDLLAALEELGLVKSEDPAKGLVHIVCPFVHEHTGGEDSGTAYLSNGGFKCHHGSCRHRRTPDFLDRIQEMLADEGKECFIAQRAFARDARDRLARLREALQSGTGVPDWLWQSAALIADRDAVLHAVEGAQMFAPVGVDVDVDAALARIAEERDAWDRPAPGAMTPVAGQRRIAAGQPAAISPDTPRPVPLEEAERELGRVLEEWRARAAPPLARLRPLPSRRAERRW